MDDFKPNSHRFKEEQAAAAAQKRVEKVVSGKAKTKKNEMRKFKDIFISEDVSNVKSYIFMDVLVPAIKKAVSDIVRDGIDMILYGEKGSGRSRSTASKISYRDYYDRGPGGPRPSGPRAVYSYEDVVLEHRGDAEAVITGMDELIERYKYCTVADMRELAGLPSNYTDYKYGWTNIHTAKVSRVRDGYLIDLPRAMPID